MTCIVGIADGTNVWMGSDSCASSPTSKVEILHNKVFQREIRVTDSTESVPVLFGGSGAFRLMQLIEYGLEIPPMLTTDDLMKYLVIDFTDAVRDLFAAKGFGKVNNNVETFEGDLLIGLKGQLFHMEESYQMIAVPTKFYSSGSGYRYAFGSLHTTKLFKDWTSEMRIAAALDAAITFDPRCAGPMIIKSI